MPGYPVSGSKASSCVEARLGAADRVTAARGQLCLTLRLSACLVWEGQRALQEQGPSLGLLELLPRLEPLLHPLTLKLRDPSLWGKVRLWDSTGCCPLRLSRSLGAGRPEPWQLVLLRTRLCLRLGQTPRNGLGCTICIVTPGRVFGLLGG